MANDVQRISVGFQGGQVLPLRVSGDEWSALRAALRDGSVRWHEVKALDAEIEIDLQQVVYVRLETEPQRVGF